MSEDISPDPSVIKPPQEGDATHIDVTSHKGDTPLGEVALSESSSSDVQVETSSDSDVVNQTREGEENYVKDKDKAEVMAHAQNDAINRNEKEKGRFISPKYAAQKAGEDFDLSVALEKVGASHVKTPEQAREYALINRDIFLKYGLAIAENYEKHGDKLPPNLAALKLVYELTKDVGFNNFATSYWGHEEIIVKLDESNGGAITVTPNTFSGRTEQWTIPMFGKGEFMLTDETADPDGKFDRVKTTRTRQLTDEDVVNLRETLKPAIKYREDTKKRQQEADFEDEDDGILRPGDDGYDDEMRNIYHGVDGSNGKSYLEEQFGIRP